MRERRRSLCSECGVPCRGRTCREHIPGTYQTAAERLNARRQTWKASASNQYEQYKQLCDDLNEPRQSNRWTTHLKELRAGLDENLGPIKGNHALLRQLIADGTPERKLRLYRWWLRRYTLDEIYAISAGIGDLSPPDHSTYVTPTRRKLAA